MVSHGSVHGHLALCTWTDHCDGGSVCAGVGCLPQDTHETKNEKGTDLISKAQSPVTCFSNEVYYLLTFVDPPKIVQSTGN